MKSGRSKYIIGELKTIGMFAIIGSLLTTSLSFGWWWFQSYGTGTMVMFGSFAVFALIGLLGSLHDDYCITIERRHKRK